MSRDRLVNLKRHVDDSPAPTVILVATGGINDLAERCPRPTLWRPLGLSLRPRSQEGEACLYFWHKPPRKRLELQQVAN